MKKNFLIGVGTLAYLCLCGVIMYQLTLPEEELTTPDLPEKEDSGTIKFTTPVVIPDPDSPEKKEEKDETGSASQEKTPDSDKGSQADDSATKVTPVVSPDKEEPQKEDQSKKEPQKEDQGKKEPEPVVPDKPQVVFVPRDEKSPVTAPAVPEKREEMMSAAIPKSFGIAVLSTKEGVSDLIQDGIHSLLLRREDLAGHAFKKAMELDPDCPWAYWGLYLTYCVPGSEGDKLAHEAIGKVRKWAKDTSLPDRDRAYMEGVVALAEEGAEKSGRVYKEIATRWKADLAAVMLASLLLHDRYDDDGRPMGGQGEAINLLDEALATHKDNHALNFMRALMEEGSPSVSPVALNCAEQAVKLAPASPDSHHLRGHLLFLSGQYEQAATCFREAANLSKPIEENESLADNEVWIKSRLYEDMSLYCQGKNEEAFQKALDLTKLKEDASRPNSPGTNLIRWEAAIMPVRMALASDSESELSSALKSLPAGSEKSITLNDDPHTVFYKALYRYLHVRIGFARHEGDARRQTIFYNEALRVFQAGSEKAMSMGAISYWIRAKQLLEQLDLDLRARAFPESSRSRREMGEELQMRSSLLLPPVMPFPVEYWTAEEMIGGGKASREEIIKVINRGFQRFPNQNGLMQFMKKVKEQES